MNKLVVASCIFVGGLGLVACPGETPGLCDDGACATADGGGDDDGAGGTDGGPVKPPPDCNPNAEPKDAPACVVDSYGIFVDGTAGSDANPGTKASPKKTLAAALDVAGAKPRVYVCEGTYAEPVKLTKAVSVFGGFACGTWTYTGTKAKVAPSDAGYALEVSGAGGAVTIADASFEAVAGTKELPSSIAAFVHGGGDVRFVRVELAAGAGANGEKGADGVKGTPDKALDGEPANGANVGPSRVCACSTGGMSVGGVGGNVNSDGQNGGPNIPENPVGLMPPQDGKGGTGNTACGSGGTGRVGANAANATRAAGAASAGSVEQSGWTPARGSDGAAGGPGQGGGGGGGRTGPGGGGACGGCGGSGGKSGTGGGASIGLLVLDTDVKLDDATLRTANGGAGGAGGAVGEGIAGGLGGNGAGTGCSGGDGGRGGNGGAGGGGAGGTSAGILHKGSAPTTTRVSFQIGKAGTPGTGGAAGENDGAAGLEGNVVAAP